MSHSSKAHPNSAFPMPSGDDFIVQKRKPLPHEFVLEAISPLSPWTRPMFGCLAVYVEEKIMLVLRDKQDHAADNGLWLATTEEHHESLRQEFPSMRSIRVLGSGVTGWQNLPADNGDFEREALRACELIVTGDPRIGKVPGKKKKRSARPGTGKKKKAPRRAKKTKRPARGRSGL